MGRAVITRIEPGDQRSVAVINANLTAIETETTNIEGQNFADESLDSTPFEALIATRRAFVPVTYELAPALVANAGAWQNLAIGATNFATGAITLEANELLRVRFAVQCTIITQPRAAWFRLVYDLGGGSILYTTSVRGHGSAAGAGRNTDGTVATMAVHAGPANITGVTVQHNEPSGAGNIQMGYAMLSGTIFRRVT